MTTAKITINTRIADLKAGDIVAVHGGLFRVTENARDSRSHFSGIGPSDTAWAPSVCIEGHCGAYFYPGSDWTLQGLVCATVPRVI